MNFIRRSVLGRRGSQDGSDLERQRPTEVEEQTQSSPRTFAFFRPSLPSLFAGRLSLGPQIHSARAEDSEHDDRPKSPGPDRLHVSRLQHIPSQQLPGDGTQDGESPSQPSRVHTRTQRFPILARPLAARTNAGESERHVRRSTFSGSRPAELHLADLVESRRRQQRATERRANSGSSRRRQQKEPPKRFLFCFPWVKSRRARSLILRCFVSGILLISILTVCTSRSHYNTRKMLLLTIQRRPRPFRNEKHQYERVQHTADYSYSLGYHHLLPWAHPPMHASRAVAEPARYLRKRRPWWQIWTSRLRNPKRANPCCASTGRGGCWNRE